MGFGRENSDSECVVWWGIQRLRAVIVGLQCICTMTSYIELRQSIVKLSLKAAVE